MGNTPRERLLASVTQADGCWGWTGKLDDEGRPRCDLRGRRRTGPKSTLARRASWEVHFGPIPPKMLVLHDGPSSTCIRPDHLRLGTYHDKTAATMRPLAERYWEKVVPNDDGCWAWDGAVNNYGYGRIQQGHRGEGEKLAHRVSWEIHNGPIPDGMSVLHRCDNPPCTRPDDLYLGTQTENMRDAWERTRRRKDQT
jgi:hypothetical protein